MKRIAVLKALVVALAVTATPGRAGVVVTQNVSPGATSWPVSPIVSTMASPAGSVATGESFNGGGGNTNLSQTFTVATTNYLLQTVDIYASGGTGTGMGTNLVLNLYDLGTQTAPSPSQYTANSTGGNLLGSGAGLSIGYNNQANAIVKLDFTGVDQVLLQNGHLYAFELSGGLNTQPLFWQRAASDTYAGGVAYRNQSWLNGASTRDFAMAVYGTVTTNLAGSSAQCTVDWNDVHQRIDGFGASSAWQSTWTARQADLFFSTNNGIVYTNKDKTIVSTNNGIGLSLLRNRIAPGGTTVETSIMQMAQARGAKVWSAPWSPAATFKSNGNVNGGGFVGNPANYQSYASQLAGYVVSMKNTYGINLYALSIQNEPDAQVTTYESCNWSAQQLHDFVPYLYNALTASNVASTKIILPESQNWPDYSNLVALAMSDSTSNLVGIVAGHNYDGANGPASLAKNSYGDALWETEVSLLSGSDSSITNGVYYAGRIHAFMTLAQANAWHYWWLMPGNSTGNQGLTDTNWVPAKRMYALGNFSRFVRPNYYRMGVNSGGAAQISAYKDSLSPSFAIIAINAGSTTVTQVFNFTNFAVANALTPWITSSNLSLASQAMVTATNSAFTYILPALSVVTFVGQADLAPTNILLSNNSILETQPLGTTVGDFSTADPDGGNTFIYDLTNGAASADNAAFTLTNGTLYTATNFNYQIRTSYTLRVRSTDQSGLWFEKNFSIAITPDNSYPAMVSILTAGDGNQTLIASGLPGHYYWLQAATNLVSPVSWLTLTNNLDGGTYFTAGLSGLWTNTDLNATNFPSRFYRTVKP